MKLSPPEAVILVVDDEPGVAELCRRVLDRAGFEVQAVSRPSLGVEKLKESRFDLLLIDIRMPEMDGFELMAIARQHQPDLAVLIMTGFGTVETAIEALRRGADGLILKPFGDTDELTRSVHEALRSSQNKRELGRLMALRPLFNITESLFSETEPDELIELLLEAVLGHLQCPHAGYYRRSETKNELYLISGRGSPPDGERSSADDGIIGRADFNNKLISASLGGPGEAAFHATLERYQLGSLLCAPVSRENESSVILAGRDVGDAIFTESDVEMFGILARQGAAALENARLYAELRAYLRQVEESQQALIQAEKMAAVGRLTASIAHEINNPLQGLGNCLHLAVREDLEPEQREEYLRLAEGELERLKATVGRMLDFYRPGKLDREDADVNELIKRVLTLLHKQLEDNEIEVNTNLSSHLPRVTVVTNQIQQVFFNIILNAMDAMSEGGELNVITKNGNGSVEILFEDTGPGVAKKTQEHIFEPFTSTREDGTGLGLSVSYNILDTHGGSLELLQEEGRGACFRIRLPIMEAT
ncbi:MAG: response regulator [Anaerolineales bacterium]|nr:response regulator [Anaerolineales bacterium]